MDESLAVSDKLECQVVDGHCRYHRLLCLKKYCEAIYGKEGCSESSFVSMEHARKGFRMQETMVVSVKKKKSRDLDIILQVDCQGYKFTFLDEVIVRSICNFISFIIERSNLKQKKRMHKEKYSMLIEMMSKFLKARSRLSLAKVIRQDLGKLHGFDCAEILYYNEDKKQLFTHFENPLQSNLDSIHTVSFPSIIGLSGDIIKTPKIRIRNREALQIFNTDIDNLVSKKEIHSFIFAPVFNSFNKVNAIIQLVNKKTTTEVNTSDIELFKTLTTIYGLLVERVVEKDSLINLVVQLKLITNVITQIFESNTKNIEDKTQLLKLSSSLRIINIILENMMGQKKEFLRDGFGADFLKKPLH